jgi:hypothetical protein
MPATPWMRYERPTAGNHYLALISYLPIKHFRAVPKFFRFTLEIQRQLRNASGLIGYALEARPFSKKSWTLSVWRDQQSLTDFVERMPHCRAMKELAPHTGESQFAQWTVQAHEIPLDWQSAKARLTQC